MIQEWRLTIFQSTFPLQGTTKVADLSEFWRGQFQSTFPLQGTTPSDTQHNHSTIYFNPRSHCRERRDTGHLCKGISEISIHVPIAGNDWQECCRNTIHRQFQSTFPLQGTTRAGRCSNYQARISIHVPIAGNDGVHYSSFPKCFIFQSTFPLQGTTNCFQLRTCCLSYFNPRSHCRERRSLSSITSSSATFQSTFPLQGTTISLPCDLICPGHFNPRSHCRERRCTLLVLSQLFYISIHVPIAGNDYLG